MPALGTKHHSPTYMDDSFDRGTANGYSRPAPKDQLSYTRPESSLAELPICEVRVRHVPKTKQVDNDDGQKGAHSHQFISGPLRPVI